MTNLPSILSQVEDNLLLKALKIQLWAPLLLKTLIRWDLWGQGQTIAHSLVLATCSLPSCSAWCAVLLSWFIQAKLFPLLRVQLLSPRIWICNLLSVLNQPVDPSFQPRNSLMMYLWKMKDSIHCSHNRLTLMWWCRKRNQKGSSPWPRWC